MADEHALTIHDLPLEERPRERMAQFGPEALNNAELLAILLRIGREGESAIRMAERLLSDFGGLSGLAKANRVQQLDALPGVGPAKAAQIMAAIELARRMSATSDELKPHVNNAADAARLVMEELRYSEQENLIALFLDMRNQLIRKKVITVGTLSGSPAHPREVFKEALAHTAASVILVHNHPSGDPTPSRDDLLLTERMVKVGELMGVPVIDHLIIGDGRYISLKESGRM